MAPKTREQRLFGAACLKLTLERRSGNEAAGVEIYEDTLRDLELTDRDVIQYLVHNIDKVKAALDAKRVPGPKGEPS